MISLRQLLFPFLFFASVWWFKKWEDYRFQNLPEEAQMAELASVSSVTVWLILYPSLILFAAGMSVGLYWLIISLRIYNYWTTVKRSSETTLRLSALCNALSQENSRLMAIAGTSGGDGAELQAWSSEASLAQLHALLEKSDLDQLEKHIGRLRDASERLNNVTRQIDQSWDRHVFDTLQSYISRLKAVKFPWQNVRHCIVLYL